MKETRDDRREDQAFKKRHNLPKNINIQPNNNRHRRSKRKDTNKKTMPREKEMYMLINTLKIIPQKKFTKSGELDISKLCR